MNKKLKNQITKKLDQLQELLDQIDEVRVINSNDPDTWDSDALYNLTEQLKETLQLLENEVSGDKQEEIGILALLED
jgi:hypothetical protein